MGKDSLSGKDVEVHALPEWIFTLHFVGFARRMHVEVVTHVILFNLFATLVHHQHPVRIRPVVASRNAVPKLAEAHITSRLLETPPSDRLL